MHVHPYPCVVLGLTDSEATRAAFPFGFSLRYSVTIDGPESVSTALFVLIYATTPPQHWGEVTQALLYHQVRATDPTFWC